MAIREKAMSSHLFRLLRTLHLQRCKAIQMEGYFIKSTEGRGPMLSFKNTLTAFNIWNIISYLRSFNPTYVQKIAPKVEGKGLEFTNTHIQLKWVQDYFQVVAQVSGEKDHVIKPVTGTEVKLFAKRYFGNLLIDGAKNTDSLGKAVFTFPTDLPGDSSGFVKMFAKLSDEESFGDIRADTSLNAGVPTWNPPLNQKRAMWNVVQKTPIWLLLTYSTVVINRVGNDFIHNLSTSYYFQVGKSEMNKDD